MSLTGRISRKNPCPPGVTDAKDGYKRNLLDGVSLIVGSLSCVSGEGTVTLASSNVSEPPAVALFSSPFIGRKAFVAVHLYRVQSNSTTDDDSAAANGTSSVKRQTVLPCRGLTNGVAHSALILITSLRFLGGDEDEWVGSRGSG